MFSLFCINVCLVDKTELPVHLDDERLLLLTEASDCPKLGVACEDDVRPGVTQPPRTSGTSGSCHGLTQS